jgi:hypothetical protein
VAFAIQQRRQHAHRRTLRTRLLLLDARDPGRLDAIDLGLVEARRAQHAGEQVERRIELFLQCRQVRSAASSDADAPRLAPSDFGAVAERQRVEICPRLRRACPS